MRVTACEGADACTLSAGKRHEPFGIYFTVSRNLRFDVSIVIAKIIIDYILPLLKVKVFGLYFFIRRLVIQSIPPNMIQHGLNTGMCQESVACGEFGELETRFIAPRIQLTNKHVECVISDCFLFTNIEGVVGELFKFSCD